MKHGSLFSGIGGFDYAAELIGWENVFHCEWNPFGQKVLKHYWPNAITYEDITKSDFTVHRGSIDILTGGFPCQPYSHAGKRLGKEDDRHLWPQMLRAIREIQPTFIVGENVPGLVNWSGGLVFEEVQADLEAEGYEVTPFILPACGVNAPHRRDRIWFVAYSAGRIREFGKKRTDRRYEQNKEWEKSSRVAIERFSCTPFTPYPESQQSKWLRPEQRESGKQEPGEHGRGCCQVGDGGVYSDTNYKGLQGSEKYGSFEGIGKNGNKQFTGFLPPNWEIFPTQSPVCNGNDGLSSISHTVAISEARNTMDRNIVTQLCLQEGRLEVDFETGKIFSLKQRGKEGQKIELLGSDCNGYIVHGIRYNGFKIQLRAHQIVWIAANGIYDKSIFMIDHINRNRKDNRLENLRLVDSKGNRENATEYNGKLTEDQKDLIFWLNREDGIPMREIAEDFGISKSRVQQIISEHSGLFGITFSKWRNETIKAGGNAIVPQVALQIFKAIESFNRIIEAEQLAKSPN